MNEAAPTGTFTGRHLLAILLAFFGVIFAANFTMAYFAFSSWTGLVVKNSYVASQEFNETTAALEKSALGVAVVATYANEQLTLTLRDNAGNAVAATNVMVTLGRPSHEGEDHNIALAPKADGIYGATHSLAKGQWAGEVSANIIGHEDWRRPLYLVVRD